MSMQTIQSFRNWALAFTATMLMLSVGIVQAQSSTTYEFDIDPSELGQALMEFGVTTGQQVMFNDAEVAGKRFGGIEGSYTSSQAIEIILADTDIDYRIDANGTLLVGQSDARQAQPGQDRPRSDPSNNRSRNSTVGNEPVALTGRVTDASSGANLDGALVVIEETEQRASTDDLGRFRFAQVAPGTYTVRVSYLGYESASERVRIFAGQDAQQNFQLGGVADLGTMVVLGVGTRSARAQALNQERTAENSMTVVSSDLLGNFTGTTIAEALRRAPGVAFEQDFATGDGTNIIVRGLAPDLNTVTFNGIELPEGSGEGRSASLNNILAGSIESVTINKTLLPNQDSAGIGGLVEIETKTPLDRPYRFAQFSVSGRERDGNFAEDFVGSAILSGRFGAQQNIGLGLSIQYRDRTTETLQAGNSRLQFGTYFPLDETDGTAIRDPRQIRPGNPFPFIDSVGGRTVFPTNLSANSSFIESENLSIGLNAAWEIGGHTELRFDYQFLEDTSSSSSASYLLTANPAISPRPVVEEGGAIFNAAGPRGTSQISFGGNVSEDVTQTTEVYSFSGSTNWNSWDFGYSAGYTNGENESPNNFLISSRRFLGLWDENILNSDAIDLIEGIFIYGFSPISPEDENGIALPNFTPVLLADIANPANFAIGSGGDLTQGRGSNDRFSSELSSRYNFESGLINYIEAGVDYERSEFESSNSQIDVNTIDPTTPLTAFGLDFDEEVLERVGFNTGLFTVSGEQYLEFLRSLSEFEQNGLVELLPLDVRGFGQGVQTKETEWAPYLQASLRFGKFEIIGGGRFTSYEIESDDLDFPVFRDADGNRDFAFEDANTVRRVETATQDRLLPRLQINYRPSDNLVFRAAYGRVIARPQLGLISDRRQYSLDLRPLFGPDRDIPLLNIQEGNEDLKPAVTDSFEISGELYNDNAGVMKINLFYDRIENLTEQNRSEGFENLEGVTLPDFPTDIDLFQAAENGELFVVRTQPINNPDVAEIWGLELAFERQFVELPGIWSGFGMFANYTYTDSSKTQFNRFRNPVTREDETLIVEDVRFNGQPEHSGTVALTYNDYGFDGALIYSGQGRRLSNFEFNGLSDYEEAFETLDLRMAYTFDRLGGQYQLSFEVTDLLRGTDDPSLIRGIGDDTIYYTNRSYLGGREFRLGLTATF